MSDDGPVVPVEEASTGRWVAGVDGCRAGWVVVLSKLRAPGYLPRVVPDFRAVLALPEKPAVIAVDVPIGLEDVARPGGRECEALARELLGERRSSVFSAPTRPALAAFRAGGDYRAVLAANCGNVAKAPGISRQTFCILPKIDEVDRALVPATQAIVREVHPELSFAEANDGTPMGHGKGKLPGRTEREALLRQLGVVAPLQLFGAKWPKGVKPDDLLDACIACWTAKRVAAGTASVLPGTPPTDSRGLRMELWR